jgi:hypothetical protein
MQSEKSIGKYCNKNSRAYRRLHASLKQGGTIFRTPNLEMASKSNLRRYLPQFGAFLLLLVCLRAQVAETFDFWDHTLQTGNDIEYSLVIVVLIVGAGFGLARVAAVVMRTLSLMSRLLSCFGCSCSCAPRPTPSTGYSPPQPLRI